MPGPSIAYLWTADDVENSRLDAQHHMFSELCWGGKPYLGLIEEALSGEGKAVLDLGTGSGIWAIDMALRFPHANVLGVDLSPKLRRIPSNCMLESHDINDGLEKWYGAFDVVHTRLISSGIYDYHRLVKEMAEVLRPGGAIEFAEWDFRAYGKDLKPMPVHEIGHPNHLYTPQWLAALREASMSRGGSVDASNNLLAWVDGIGLFEHTGHCTTWLPLAAPVGDTREEQQHMEALHRDMKEDLRFFAQAARPALSRRVSEDKLSELEGGMLEELDSSTETMYARVEVVWGRRKA